MAKIETFPLGTGYSCAILRVKNLLEIALFLTVFKIFSMFYFPIKSKMPSKSGENWIFFRLTGILLYYPVGQKFTRNLSISYVFEIFTLFHFPLKSKMATKSKHWNFTPRHKILLYYPVGQKFAWNCSISYGFRDIHTFSFSAQIQDGCQKWWKLKFFCTGNCYKSPH